MKDSFTPRLSLIWLILRTTVCKLLALQKARYHLVIRYCGGARDCVDQSIILTTIFSIITCMTTSNNTYTSGPLPAS